MRPSDARKGLKIAITENAFRPCFQPDQVLEIYEDAGYLFVMCDRSSSFSTLRVHYIEDFPRYDSGEIIGVQLVS
jgi:hypothetical protein